VNQRGLDFLFQLFVNKLP